MQFVESTALMLMCFLLATIVDAQECGKRNINPTLVTGGQDAVRGEFPWVVAIYGQQGGHYIYLCGGTLIRANIVIAGANCVTNSYDSTLQNATDYKVALGKLYREYDEGATNTGAQFVDVKSFSVPRRFRGNKRNFENDIAVLKLTSHVRLTRTVNVACVEFSKCSDESVLPTGTKGTVAGWGINNNYADGPRKLQWLDLPWIDDEQCLDEIHEQRQKYLTMDKFCAGYVNQTKSVCAGDSGVGFMVLKDGRYYLRGVASTKLSFSLSHPNLCSADFYTAFTNIAFHSDWLKREIGEEDVLL